MIFTNCSGVKRDMRYAEIQLDEFIKPQVSVTVSPRYLSCVSRGVHSMPLASMRVTGSLTVFSHGHMPSSIASV